MIWHGRLRESDSPDGPGALALYQRTKVAGYRTIRPDSWLVYGCRLA
jgi:hypothetical protein